MIKRSLVVLALAAAGALTAGGSAAATTTVPAPLACPSDAGHRTAVTHLVNRPDSGNHDAPGTPWALDSLTRTVTITCKAQTPSPSPSTVSPSPASPSPSVPVSPSAPVSTPPGSPSPTDTTGVVLTGGSSSSLPVTGTPLALIAGSAVVLLAAGLGLVVMVRRRRSA